jgi:autotransporter-associated beta strand protein
VFATGGGTYSGGFTLDAGTIIMRGINAMGNGALVLNGGIIASNATRNVTARYTSFSIAGNVQFGELSTNVALADSGANLTFADNVSLGSAIRTLTVGNNGIQTFSGVISNTSGGITFAANSGVTGRFAITNTANTFTGNISITGGEARFTVDGSLGNAANDIIVDGGRLSFASGFTLGGGREVFLGDGTGTSIDVVSGTQIINTVIANKSGETGSFSKQGTGTLELGGANTFSGSTTVAAGTLTLTNGLALQNSALDTAASITGTSSAGLKTTVTALTLGGLSGNKNLSSVFTTTAGGFSGVTGITLNPSTGSLDYSGENSNGAGNMTLTKTGAGTQVLSGINTYSGSTTIEEGVLSLSGTGTLGTGDVILDGGTLNITGLTAGSYTLSGSQELSGSGTINATGKTLIVDSILAPGFSPGTIDVTGDFTLGSISTSNFEIEGTGAGEYDRLNVTGTLTFGGTLNLFTAYTFELGDTVQLFNAGSFSGTFSDITGTDLGGGFSWNTSNLHTTGSISVIPEPCTALLGGLGLLALLRRRRVA